MDHADHLVVQWQSSVSNAGEQSFETRCQRLHCIQIDRSSRAFQTVRAAERLIQLRSALGFRDVFEQRQDRANMRQMVGVLALENSREFLVDPGQILYPAVAVCSCMLRSVRLAAALSVCRLLVAACSLPWLRSFMARATLSKPICCWLVPATIC